MAAKTKRYRVGTNEYQIQNGWDLGITFAADAVRFVDITFDDATIDETGFDQELERTFGLVVDTRTAVGDETFMVSDGTDLWGLSVDAAGVIATTKRT